MQNRLMKKLINTSGNFWIKPPFFCDYGYNIYIGENVMLNYGCILLDVCPIRIGAYTLIGPNVQIYTACHSLDPKERMKNIEYGKAVTIGNNVWIVKIFQLMWLPLVILVGFCKILMIMIDW